MNLVGIFREVQPRGNEHGEAGHACYAQAWPGQLIRLHLWCTLHNLVQPSCRIWCSSVVESMVHSGAETGAHSAPCQLASNASDHQSAKQSCLGQCVALAESTMVAPPPRFSGTSMLFESLFSALKVSFLLQ